MQKDGLLVVVSGFAGTGKGTLMKRLIADYDNYALSVSMTTRNPRPGEEHGREYFFVSKEEFEKTIAEDGLIEYACYVENYYGTPKDYVNSQRAAGKNVLLEIELQGALKVKEKFPEAVLVFVLPPSGKILKERLVGRGTETPEVVEKRMRRAAEEAQYISQYDYIVVNDDLDTCVKELHAIIESAHHRPSNNTNFITEIQNELSQMAKGE
ncbi:MAG: guanylate kinase [Lachnospiraceae bacterium]|jgi:guanylate kinase|nr:guanylate kinase [Lachnospiraceae bacterium]